VAYLKYHTQNPNVSNDSYLVLDETEINFIWLWKQLLNTTR
jgi:hypothetical protein